MDPTPGTKTEVSQCNSDTYKSVTIGSLTIKNTNYNDFSFAVNAYNWYYSSRGNFLLLFCNEKNFKIIKLKNFNSK